MENISTKKAQCALLLEESIRNRNAEKVIELIYAFYYVSALGIARRLTIPNGVQHDVVQESAIKFFQHLSKDGGFQKFEDAENPASSLLQYFFTIVHNKGLDTLKKGKKQEVVPVESLEHPPSAQSEYLDKIDQEILQSMLKQYLGETKYQILEMYNQGYNLQEIADEMSMTLSNVKYHKLDAEKKARSIHSDRGN